jgi:hypothetical protein
MSQLYGMIAASASGAFRRSGCSFEEKGAKIEDRTYAFVDLRQNTFLMAVVAHRTYIRQFNRSLEQRVGVVYVCNLKNGGEARTSALCVGWLRGIINLLIVAMDNAEQSPVFPQQLTRDVVRSNFR